MIKFLITIITIILIYLSSKISKDKGVMQTIAAPEITKNSLIPVSPNVKVLLTPEVKEEIQKQEIYLNQNRKCESSADILIVDITINSQIFGEPVIIYRMTDGSIIINEDIWKQFNLIPFDNKTLLPDCSYGYLLPQTENFNYKFNSNLQSLDIIASASAFQGVIFGIPVIKYKPIETSPGFFVNYNLTGTAANTNSSLGGSLGVVGFNKYGSVSTEQTLLSSNTSNKSIRTDTFFQKDLPDAMETFVVGDAISSDGEWSRPTRYLGVRWSRNFLTQPGYITYPSPSLKGSASLPSVVDVYINNQKQFQQNLTPGPFDYRNVPLTTGQGDINLVVKDLLGRETIVSQSFYTQNTLLKEGLSDFSMETGFFRKNYGINSNDYSSPFASATYRKGITNSLTGESRLELGTDRQAIGADLTTVVGTLGSINVATAVSTDNQKNSGSQYNIGIERRTNNYLINAQYKSFSKGYEPIAYSSSVETRTNNIFNATASVPIYKNTTTSLSYIEQTSYDTNPFRSVSLTTGVTLPFNISLSATANKTLTTDKAWYAGLNFNIPLGPDYTSSETSNRQSNGNIINTVNLTQNTPAGTGVGWGLNLSDDVTQQARANLIINTDKAQFTSEINQGQNNNAIRLGTSGSLGYAEGLSFASRNIADNSIAIVKVGDLKNIPVYNQNQIMTHTNDHGLAFLTIRPYEKAKISIDPNTLPLDVDLNVTKKEPVPYAKASVIVDFDINRLKHVLITLLQADGSFVPAGSKVTIKGQNEFFYVGRRGEVYITNLEDVSHLTITWKEHTCEFDIEYKSAEVTDSDEKKIGPLKCIN
jgi:outer membrane usher protein